MRILEGAAAARYVRKLEQRGQKLDALEPQVRRIVQSVRKNGDRALRRYAERWDGLSSGDSLRVSGLRVLESEMRSALKWSASVNYVPRWRTLQSVFANSASGKK